MGGIEKMTEQILADAKNQAQEILDKAQKEADEEKKKASAKEAAQKERAQSSLSNEIKTYQERAASSRDLMRRRLLLEKKQEIIADIMDKTLLHLKNADTATYFSRVYQMVEHFAHEGDGKLYLNKTDLDRKPSDFNKKVDEIAAKKNGTIEVMSEEGNLSDGFMLIYGGTQENCSFEALIESEKNRLQDEINRMLWRENNG